MKTIFFMISFFLVSNVEARDLVFEEFDQEKLADLVNRLPETVKTKQVARIVDPTEGILVRSIFPKQNLGFRAVCESRFYHHSPYPSYSSCTMSVDEHHPLVLKKYDEYKIAFNDPAVVAALFGHISFGRPNKDFRSFGKEEGTSFAGKNTWVFHYRFDCSSAACNVYFSDIIGKGLGETRDNRLIFR